jgi:hypothetical protein
LPTTAKTKAHNVLAEERCLAFEAVTPAHFPNHTIEVGVENRLPPLTAIILPHFRFNDSGKFAEHWHGGCRFWLGR